MNKKGENDEGYSETGNSIHAITLLIFATIMAVSLTLIVSHAVSQNLIIDKNTEQFFSYEAVRNCFLQKVNGRTYYQTINPELITDERLEQCVPNSNIVVTLKNKKGKLLKNATSGTGTISGDSIKVYPINIINSLEKYNLVVHT